MARKIVLAAALAAAVLLPGSGGSPADAARARPGAATVDYYIAGTIIRRVPGRNRAVVEIKWDFKCLGDQLGDATYEWSLKAVRRQPRPEQTIPITSGTSKRGEVRRSLAPGAYEPIADPFRCVTDRGAGSRQPEVGRTFVVPDYCAWTIARSRGRVSVDQRRAVRAARRGDTVRPGDGLSAGARSSVALVSKGGDSALALHARSRLRIDAQQCGRQGGWKLALAAGTVTAEVRPSADAQRRYTVESPNAVATGGRGKWMVVTTGTGRSVSTRVRVLAGRVTVGNLRGGRRVVVSAGRSTVVSGSAPPTAPR